MTNIQLHKEIEKWINHFLSQQSELAKSKPGLFTNYLMRPDIYRRIQSETQLGNHVTAGIFNYVIHEMKKAGLIGLAKGGQQVFFASVEATHANMSSETLKTLTELTGARS